MTLNAICNSSVIEIASDQGRSYSADGQHLNRPSTSIPTSTPICKIECELTHCLSGDVVVLARQGCKAHGLSISTITKTMKGQRLSSTGADFFAVLVPQPAFEQRLSKNNIFKAEVSNYLGQILPNVSELASGSGQPLQPLLFVAGGLVVSLEFSAPFLLLGKSGG